MLQNFAKFQKFQLENLVDFEKCCKTHLLLQKSVPIQPKTNNILPKFCQKLAPRCFADILPLLEDEVRGPGRRRGREVRVARAARRDGEDLGCALLAFFPLLALEIPWKYSTFHHGQAFDRAWSFRNCSFKAAGRKNKS